MRYNGPYTWHFTIELIVFYKYYVIRLYLVGIKKDSLIRSTSLDIWPQYIQLCNYISICQKSKDQWLRGDMA